MPFSSEDSTVALAEPVFSNELNFFSFFGGILGGDSGCENSDAGTRARLSSFSYSSIFISPVASKFSFTWAKQQLIIIIIIIIIIITTIIIIIINNNSSNSNNNNNNTLVYVFHLHAMFMWLHNGIPTTN